jgi:hypothetical protein
MSTQKTKPDPGALDRKVGAFAMAAAIGLVAVACTPGTRDGQRATAPADQPPTAYPSDPKAEEVATGFVRAFGAFDGEGAITYLADGAYLEMDVSTPEEVPVFTSFLEAQGYEQILVDPCRVTGTSASGTAVRCRFDWHAIRSDEMGLGPYPGSWDLTVREGEIVSVSLHWEFTRFSSQMWEPFADWVSETYPKDFQVMYTGGGTNFSLTEESIRLWRQHTREYVRVAIARMAENGEVDYVVDLNTEEITPLPETIIRTLGEAGEGGWPAWLGQQGCIGGPCSESRYAVSPDGSLLAYVGTGDEGTPQIFIAGIDGTGVRQMTHDPTGATWPAWSPDGTMIAFAKVGTEGPMGLFVLDVATGESTQVTDETGMTDGLQFTPDGVSLLYTSLGPEGGLRTVPIAGGRSTLLLGQKGNPPGDLYSVGNGSLSPDGSLLTFNGPESRWVANADGSERRELPGCYDSIPAGTWSPDGSRIVCNESDPPTYRTILVIDVATGDARRVARGSAAIWLDDHTLLVEV